MASASGSNARTNLMHMLHTRNLGRLLITRLLSVTVHLRNKIFSGTLKLNLLTPLRLNVINNQIVHLILAGLTTRTTRQACRRSPAATWHHARLFKVVHRMKLTTYFRS